MANAVSYMRNVTKSVKYSAIDSMKKMNPVITSFYDSNQDVINETYRAIKDIKGTTKSQYSKAIDGEVGGLAKTYFRNLMEDAKSGKFYNKDRKERDLQQASIEFSGLDDMDFGIEFDDDDITFDDDSSNISSISVNDIDSIAAKSTSAVGQIMARSAQYQVEAQRQTTKVLYDQNAAIFGNIHSSLGVINSNVGMIFNYMKENTNTHYENSKTFYENATGSLNQTNEILKEMLELQKKQVGFVEKSYSTNDRVKYSDLFTAEGALDIKEYIRLIKQNIKDKDDGTGEMLKMFTDPGMLKTFTSSPLQGITDAVVKMVTPKMLKDAFGDFNKSLSGFFGSLIMKLSQDDNIGIMSTISEYLGFKNNLKKKFDTSNYNKGVVPFDGVTRKAIVDVIPTYLSKIYSAVSNTKESRYDYDRGQFVTVDSLKKELQQMFDQSSYNASMDIKREFDSYSKAFSFKGDKERQDQFEKDMKIFFDYYFKNAKLYDKKLKAKDYGMTSKYSEENLALFQKMWEMLPSGLKMQYASNIMNSRESFNRRMESAESDSLSPLTALFNGSLDESIVATNTAGSVKETVSKKDRKTKKRKKNTPKQKDSGPVEVDESVLSRIYQERMDEYHEDDSDFSISGMFTEALLGDSKAIKATQKALDKPTSLLSSILHRIDTHLYTFIFGDDKFDADAENNGMFNAIFHKIQDSFDRFNIWIDQNVLFPLRDKFSKEKVKDAAKSFFGMFGIDIESMASKAKEFLFGNKKSGESGIFSEFTNEVKSSFKGLGSYIKQSFLDVGNYFGIFGKKNTRGEAKSRKNKTINEGVRRYMGGTRVAGADQDSMEDSLMETVINADDRYKSEIGIGSVENAAEGVRRVSRTGVIVASEGEMIIPPDRNPFNIARRYRKENKAKDKFLSHINNYAEGGTVGYDKDRVQKNIKDALGMKSALNRDDYEDLHIGYKVADELRKLFGVIRDTVSDLTGKAKEKISETDFGKNGFSNVISDVMTNIKQYAPDMVVGSGIGAGVSVLTSAIGGPLLGAASGAAISLIKNSKTVQKWLFGEIGEDGERKGGLFKKDIADNISKYAPDMTKGATLGAITSIMPFVPGGPVAGIIIGSSIGFAKNNEKIQNALFGEEGLLGKDFPEKVKKTLPKMGAGAVLGLVGGPFGVATNVVLGSAIGFATETQTFQKLIFGEEDAEGNREGGLLGMLKESVIEPNKQFFGNMFKEFREWFNTDIKDNVNKFIGPMQQDIKNLSRNLYRYIAKKVDGLFDKFLQSAIGQKLDKAITGINNIFQGTVGKLFGFGKGVVSLPFKALGRYGDSRRTKQIKTGNADMMSAAERVAFRSTDAFKKRSRFYRARDQFADVDTVLANMNNDEISSLFDNVEYARDAKKKIKNDKRQVYKNLNSIKDLRAVEPKTYKMLVGYVEDGNIGQIEKTIDSLDSQYTDNNGNIRNLDKKQLKESLIKNAQKFKRAKDAEQSINQTQQTAMEEASKVLGVDLSRVKDSKLYDYLKEEAKVRGVGKKEKYRQEGEKTIEEMIDDKQQERHAQVVDLFEKANYYLRMIVDDDFRKKELGKTKETNEPEETKESQRQLPAIVQPNNQTSNKEIDQFEGDVIDENGNVVSKTSIRDRIRSASNKLRNNKFIQSISNAFSPMVVHAAESENQQEQFLPAVQTEFYQGKTIKYTKSKDGSYNPDKSDSETVEALAAIDEDKQTQKGILGSLTSLPGKFFSLFGAKEGDEKKDKKESIFSKLLKNAIKVAGFGALIAFAPKIYDFYNENIKPHIIDFVEGFKAGWNDLPEMFDNGTGKIGQLFGDKLHDGLSLAKDWMSGSGQFEGRGFPYLLNDKIIPNALEGFEWLMGNVVPKAVEIIAKSLPSIIWSGVKGLGSLISGLINKDDTRVNTREYDDNTTIDTVNVGKRSNELNYEPSNAWSLSGSIGGTSSNITTSGSGSTTVKALDKAATAMGITSERRKETKSVSKNLPKAFSYTNKYQQQKALDSYNQVKDNVVTINGYGDMSVSELLNRDDIVIANTTDKNGNTVNITGADILNYPDIAAQFGIDSRLTSEELIASTKEVAGSSYGSGIYDGKSKVIEAGMRAFASGRTGKISSGLRKVGNALSKSSAKSATKAGSKLATGRIGGGIMAGAVSSVKKAGSVAATSLGKGLDILSDLGARYLPSGIVGTDNKTKAISSMVQKMTSRGSSSQSNSVLSAVKGTDQKKANTSLGKKVSELGTSALNNLKEKVSQTISDSLKDKLVKKVRQLIPEMFTNNKLVNWIKNFMSEASEKLTATSLENALKTFGEKLGAKVASKLGQQAGKLVGKVATKAAALVGTAGVSTILSAVTGFINGWRNADQLLNISEPTFLQKVISGATYAINDTFCFGLIPLEDLFDFALDIAQQIPVFSGIIDNIKDQQTELTNEVQKYNMRNGTELTVDEYLDKQKKEKSIISKAGNAIKSAGKSVGNAVAETASGVVKNVKSLFTGIFNSKKTTDDNSDISTIKTTSNEDAVLFTYSDLVAKQSRVFASPLTLLAESGEKIKEIFDKYLGGFKKVSKTINSESNSTIKSAENNDLDSFWGNKNSDTSLWGTFTSIFTQMQKVIMYPVAFVNNLISTLTKPFQSLINKVKSNPIVETASNIVSTIVGWFNKGNNSSSSSSKFSGWSFFSDKDKDKSSKESEDKSEESTSLNGSGSGLLHRIRTVVSGSGTESNKSTEDPYYAKPVSALTSTNDARKMKQEQLFVSQTNNNLSSKRFNTDEDTKKQTVADTGCAPAVSTMAINLANRYGITSSKQTFSNAIKNALNYKVADEGVTADYFIDEFGKKGMSTAFISSNSSSNMKESIVNMLKGNKPVVLMGTDSNNTNKQKSPFGPSGHYVLATGVSDDGKYIYINDPESKTPNIKYSLDSLIKSVSLGMAAVKKNTTIDNKIKNSKVTEFLRKFRGRSLTGSSNEEKCWNFFISQGFSEAATAGVMGNIYVESHFDPSIHQIGGGPGRGLCQWEASSSGGSGRYNNLVKFANEKGKSWDDLETQLQFVIYECTNGSMTPFFKLIGGLDAYMKSTEPKQAAKDWLIAFELCGTNYNFNNFDIGTRQSKAEEFYARYTGTGIPGTLGSYSSSSTGDSSTIVSTPAWQNPKSILDLYSIFDDLATIYGVGNSSSSTTSITDTSSSSSVSGATVSDAQKAELQKKMAQSFIKSENNLKTYSQVNRYNYKISDDGTITGTSADCSSLAQGVYKKFLNVDPGSWTGAMLQSSNTYTVEKGSGSPGSAPTESKLQLGDLIVYGPNPSGSHVEMYVGDGKTMGHGSAPGPHYASNSSVQNGKVVNWHSQNKGLNEVRRWTGFQGEGSGLINKNKHSKVSNIITKNGKSFRKIFSGRGTDVSGKSIDYITSNYTSSGESSSKNILSNVFGNDNVASNVYDYTTSTGSDVYATVNNTTNNNISENNNSAQLVSMLKAIVQILVKLVDNSENMKQIVSLLTQLVTIVSTTNSDKSQSKTEKAASAATIKANLLNTINTASQSSPDKELIDIINNMEALASM